MKTLYFIVIMFVSGLCQGEIYRCLDEYSNITFMDTPCHSQSRPYEIKQSMALKLKTIDEPKFLKAKNKRPRKSDLKSSSCQRFSATQLRNLRVKDQFQKGMPSSAIVKRFGKAQVNNSSANNQQTWIYKSTRVKRTFKFKDDCLTSWKEKWHGKKSKLSKYQQ